VPLPCRLFPLHIPTALKSDLFSSENVKWPKQGRKGGLFVWDPAKKGPVTGARPPPGHFTRPLDADFCDLSKTGGGQLVEIGVNWPRRESQLTGIGVNWSSPPPSSHRGARVCTGQLAEGRGSTGRGRVLSRSMLSMEVLSIGQRSVLPHPPYRGSTGRDRGQLAHDGWPACIGLRATPKGLRGQLVGASIPSGSTG
jgi:hypothetical protein